MRAASRGAAPTNERTPAGKAGALDTKPARFVSFPYSSAGPATIGPILLKHWLRAGELMVVRHG
jgi:hypothetical protein